ncbi:18S rRNA biogenesis protein RCL1 [Pneumocystis murina B123]|uniref:18S rRNA biogenesis protein RCL1 n=1 Tax=Pneumocystis murina (strain B123) TaxID=1069680 RepID=M7NWN2_PNEMU|nr:18S rRNA biogenesis protein RCL1 [Pneumocystis murina B123]EMR11561.1 18S rRNA biogenesis protein RCL1 [Pneumocystis murina B123]
MATQILRFQGHEYFTQRLILSLLSKKMIRIEKIRSDDTNPGLRDYEISFLRLLETITNGSQINISYTGTIILFKPGQIHGGKFTHDCGTSRSIGYFLLPLLSILPFSKIPFDLTFTGLTVDNYDVGVDIIRTSILPIMRKFGINDGLELRILKRGSSPLGGGEIRFICPSIRALCTVHLLSSGRIKRIRGVASSTCVSPSIANRLVESARSILNRFIPDIFIYTDVRKGEECGKSPGFSLSLVAESNTESLYTSELSGEAGDIPEDIGINCAKILLSQILNGGCVDNIACKYVLLGMVLGSEDVGRIRISRKIDEHLVAFLRDVKLFFNIEMRFIPSGNEIIVSCKGIGYTNYNKMVT